MNPNDAIISQLLEPRLTVGERTALKIIDGAIKCYAKAGFDGASFEKIAKAAGVSRQLLLHYFKSKEELFTVAVKRVRLGFQQMAVEAIQKAATPKAQLEAYVDSTFDWIEKFPNHPRMWLLYLYQCASDKDHRKLNTELVETGHTRIAALLKGGADAGDFAEGRFEERAKLIQMLITGALATAVTEDLKIELSALKQSTREQCTAIAATAS